MPGGMGGSTSSSSSNDYWPNTLDAAGMLYFNMRDLMDQGGSLGNFYNRYAELGKLDGNMMNMFGRYLSSVEPHMDYNKYRSNVLNAFDTQAGAAKDYLDKIATPAITNKMTAMGMGRSGAIGENIAGAAQQMALPLAQARAAWEANAPQQMNAFTSMAKNLGGIYDLPRQAQLEVLKNQQGLYQMGMTGLSPLFSPTSSKTTQTKNPGFMDYLGMATQLGGMGMMGMGMFGGMGMGMGGMWDPADNLLMI